MTCISHIYIKGYLLTTYQKAITRVFNLLKFVYYHEEEESANYSTDSDVKLSCSMHI